MAKNDLLKKPSDSLYTWDIKFLFDHGDEGMSEHAIVVLSETLESAIALLRKAYADYGFNVEGDIVTKSILEITSVTQGEIINLSSSHVGEQFFPY